MLRQIAGGLTGTAVSTVRFATAIPLGVARTVLEHVKHHVSDEEGAGQTGTARRPQPPQRDPQEQAAETSTATPAASRKTSTPAKTRKTTGTAKAGDVRPDDDGPDVVLAVDAPPVEIEPPVDVVGEALAAEEEQKAQEPPRPQPVHVNEQTEVVYSTTSDDD